jgi:transposase
MTRPDHIPIELWDTFPPVAQLIIADQHHRILTLEARVAQLTARVAELEAQLRQTSANSSKPPSTDGPQAKPAPPKPPSGKKPGGQPGHPKHERTILPPDAVVEHKPTHCGHCQHELTGDDPQPELVQVLDLPPTMRHVIHHRRHTLTCPHCHRATPAPAFDGDQFGPKLQATVALLGGVGRLSKRTIRTILHDVCDVPISLGAVSDLEAKTATALEPIHEAALKFTHGRDANIDETGWKQGTKRAWLWTAVTLSVTVFLVRLTRSRVAFDDLRANSGGVLTTDRYAVYDHLKPDRRQVCWAHLRRDFQAMIDRANAGSGIGDGLLLHADILFDHWRKVRDGTRTRRWFERVHGTWLREEVRLLLVRGSACGCAKTAGVCRELLAVEASLWTFAGVPGVEPTNNAAERAVRHAVCWRKTSHGTQSERGSRFVERILTVVATCRQQGRSVMTFLREAIQAERTGTARPSLLPATA